MWGSSSWISVLALCTKWYCSIARLAFRELVEGGLTELICENVDGWTIWWAPHVLSFDEIRRCSSWPNDYFTHSYRCYPFLSSPSSRSPFFANFFYSCNNDESHGKISGQRYRYWLTASFYGINFSVNGTNLKLKWNAGRTDRFLEKNNGYPISSTRLSLAHVSLNNFVPKMRWIWNWCFDCSSTIKCSYLNSINRNLIWDTHN